MSNISRYNPGQELSSLNFGNLIGGPLSAVVEAQILAAESTVKYIKDVGFDENGDPEYVTFTYPKEISPYQSGTPHSINAKVDNQGKGYNVTPKIEIIGDGYGAVAEAVMVSDGTNTSGLKVERVVITKQGFNYTNVSEIKILPVGGTGAKFNFNVANINTGNISSVTINGANSGANYTHPPILNVKLKPSKTGNGSGAILEAVINKAGVVIGVNVLQEGSEYNSSDYEIEVINPTFITNASTSVLFTSGTPSTAAQFLDMKLEVPLLTMVPIPYIRVEETTIEFNAKINSVEKINSEREIDFKIGLEYENENKYSRSRNSKKKGVKKSYKSSGTSKTKFNVSASYKRKDSRGTEIDKTYTMGISVKAVQDEIPAGMEKVLGILENAIISQPSA
ncbi:hypothetical protein CXF68_01725 [Tenacibaculum sp. Bg11-29]|uniref:DUF2589 domain-containing protein n=1 Tax=Tenacibaculum sp. Bg11-29 TaxID=2058306 RepID=UPI000C32D588|nr:DUF2589 domain-containing protein [Tenacibaculum sp. Bg11-29]PKH49483.1 hypothetical protein CXF68_01725 [Tenacibaculum sp. Bg11-29]